MCVWHNSSRWSAMKPPGHSSSLAPSHRSSQGFTLIELLIALALLAVVALLAWRGLDQVARGQASLSRAMESERALSQLYNQMHDDLQQAVRDDDVSVAPIHSEPGSLQIIRALRVPGETTRLQVIRYQLRDRHVMRYASSTLTTVGQLHDLLAPGASMAGWSSVALAGDALDFNTRLYVPHSGWADDWQSAQNAMLINQNTLPLPGSGGGGPAPRDITGVQLVIHVTGQQGPLTRIFVVGE